MSDSFSPSLSFSLCLSLYLSLSPSPPLITFLSPIKLPRQVLSAWHICLSSAMGLLPRSHHTPHIITLGHRKYISRHFEHLWWDDFLNYLLDNKQHTHYYNLGNIENNFTKQKENALLFQRQRQQCHKTKEGHNYQNLENA